MTHWIDIEDRGTYVCVCFFGDWLKGEGESILDEIFSAIVASGHTKALVDYRKAGAMQSDSWMDFDEASHASELPNVARYRFAVLFRADELDRFRFWETVALNRWIDMRFFSDEAEALQWLVSPG